MPFCASLLLSDCDRREEGGKGARLLDHPPTRRKKKGILSMERGWRRNLTLFAMLAWVEIPWDRAVTAAMVSFLWSSSHKKHLLHVLRWVRLSKIGVEEALSRSYRRSGRERDRPCSRFLFKVFQKRASVSLSSQSQGPVLVWYLEVTAPRRDLVELGGLLVASPSNAGNGLPTLPLLSLSLSLCFWATAPQQPELGLRLFPCCARGRAALFRCQGRGRGWGPGIEQGTHSERISNCIRKVEELTTGEIDNNKASRQDTYCCCCCGVFRQSVEKAVWRTSEIYRNHCILGGCGAFSWKAPHS